MTPSGTVATFRKGEQVFHARTGWSGWIYGAGPGRSPGRWNNPSLLYVDWFHRKPSATGHLPSEIEHVPTNLKG